MLLKKTKKKQKFYVPSISSRTKDNWQKYMPMFYENTPPMVPNNEKLNTTGIVLGDFS